MEAISLFSGAGGMDVGFKAAGFHVVAANEFDRAACETFRLNHPDVDLHEGDLAQLVEKICAYNDIDLVFGGPPCQGFSVAGKMLASDPRSQLVFRFLDVVERVKPRAFVMENVKALATLQKFQDVRKEIAVRSARAGYSLTMQVLNAKDFGVPQSRERVFFVGLLNSTRSISTASFEKYRCAPPTLREAIGSLGRAGTATNRRVCNAKVTIASRPVLRKSPYAGMLFNGQGRPLNPDGWASTLPASMGGNRTPIVDEAHLYDYEPAWVEAYHGHLISGGSPLAMNVAPSRLRRLTIDEAALLQGFPVDYLFSGSASKVFCQIGNAVPCGLAKVVGNVVRDVLVGQGGDTPSEPAVGVTRELVYATD